jgi:5-methylcytosine-specific restriction endonuclease McrA
MYEVQTYKDRQTFYNSVSWRTLREYKLSEQPLCERCFKNKKLIAASEVHHKIDLRDAPELQLSFSNLESLCKSCHSTETITHINLRNKHKIRSYPSFKRLYHL